MLLMERLFGPAGVVAAPVFYAWLKVEWHRWDAIRGADEPASA
jgi:predicted PurR-regulated permease PerM